MAENDELLALEAREDLVFGNILKALRYLADKGHIEGVWRDPENDPEPYRKTKKDSGVVMALEALLSFLIPLHFAKDHPDLQKRIFAVMPENVLADEVVKALSSIHDASFIFSGEPYISVIDNNGNHHPFIDTACLALSVILYADRVLRLPAIPPEKTLFQSVFDAAIKVIDGCLIRENKDATQLGKLKGWFFTNYRPPNWHYKYCSWMAADTLSDITSVFDIQKKDFCPPDSVQIVGSLQGATASLCAEFGHYYMDQDPSRPNVCVRTGIVREDEVDQSVLQYNIWIILTLLYFKYDTLGEQQKRYIHEALSWAMRYASRVPFAPLEAVIFFESDAFTPARAREVEQGVIKNVLRDRAALPQWIKALSIALIGNPDWRDTFGSHLDEMVDTAFENRDPAVGAWDAAAEGHFSLYLTERYIEALTKYGAYLDTQIREKRPSVPAKTAALTALERPLDLGPLAERIAQVVAENAVVLQINDDKARQIVEKIATRLAEKATADVFAKLAVEMNDRMSELVEPLEKKIGELQAEVDQIRINMPRRNSVQEVFDERQSPNLKGKKGEPK